MNKKIIAYLLISGLLLSVFGCNEQDKDSDRDDSMIQESKEDNSAQESHFENSEIESVFRVPEDWTGPEIFRCRVPEDWMQGKKVDQAIHQLGRDFLESRICTEADASDAIEKYGYNIEGYTEYTVKEAVLTSLPDLSASKKMVHLQVQQDDQTWIIGYSATVTKSKWIRLPKNGGPELTNSTSVKEGEKEIREWNLGDWWIIHQEGTVFSMMSYTDYRCIKETYEEYSANPFEAYVVSAETIPEVEFWDYEGRPYWTDEIRYFEPLQAYINKDSIIFEYTPDPDESIENVMLVLGRQYLEELCSKEYDPARTGPQIKPSDYYYAKEYEDLEILNWEASLERTVEKMAEKSPDVTGFISSHRHIPSDSFLLHDYGTEKHLKAGKNIWMVSFQAQIKSDDPVWGKVQLGPEEILPPGEGFKRNSDAAINLSDFVVIKEENRYFMVDDGDIIMESDVRTE